MEEDTKILNLKDCCKISVPIVSNQELDEFNNILDIETEYEKLIKKVSEQVYKEKECILLQQIIKKQERTIENLIARNKELEDENKELKKMEDLTYEALKNTNLIHKNYISKSIVREKIEENKWAIEHYDCDEADYKQSQAVGAWNALIRLLQEGDK